jgi:hypothetical protein
LFCVSHVCRCRAFLFFLLGNLFSGILLSVGDSALVCRGFADWCDAVRWWPTILQLGARLDRIRYVPVPEIEP